MSACPLKCVGWFLFATAFLAPPSSAARLPDILSASFKFYGEGRDLPGDNCVAPSTNLPPGVACRAVPDPNLSVPPYVSPYTAPDIPLDYKQQCDGCTLPEQVAVYPATRNGSSVFVRFIVPRADAPAPCVTYGEAPDALLLQGRPWQASQYTYGPYTSGTIHVALLGPLAPSTVYFYQVEGRSEVFQFTSLPAPGAGALHLALVGDVGQTWNSTSTLANVQRSPASLVLFAGDLTYADHYGPPCRMPPVHPGAEGGSDAGSVEAKKRKECGMGGLRWDSWGRMSEDVFSRKLSAYVPGNHELEYTPSWHEVEPFKAYRARIPSLLDDYPITSSSVSGGASNTDLLQAQALEDYAWPGFPAVSPLFYSLDVGPAHIIGLSSYSPFVKYSHQWNWLLDDLCDINRTATPWIIVFLHVPLYSSNIEHYNEGEPIRQELEDFLQEAGVDLIFAGHVHAYERSFPVHRMLRQVDGCGIVHITVGDGGNIEKVAGPFVEPQPSYSAVRQETFGHAELVIDSPSTASYRWYRNEGGKQVLGDEFNMVNKQAACHRSRPSFCRAR